MNPVTFDELRDALLSWVADISGLVALLANSGDGEAPRPRTPYVEVFIDSNEVPTSQYESIDQDTGIVETVSAQTYLSVTLNVYGGNAMQVASRLCRSLYSAQRYVDLWKVCGLGGVESVVDLTALERGALKQRAEIKLMLYCVLYDTFDSDYFDSVPYSITKNSETV